MRAVCRDVADLYGPRKIVTLEQMAKQQEASEKAQHRIQLLQATEKVRNEIFRFRAEQESVKKENVPEDKIEQHLQEQYAKIYRHVGAMLSNADQELLQVKFGQATQDEITTAVMEDEISDYTEWINGLRVDIIQGKFDDPIHPKDKKRAGFMKRAHDNQTRDQYSQDRSFAWRRWVISEKQPICGLSAEQVVNHFGPIWNHPPDIHDRFQPSPLWQL
jgi:hypothetical protein